MPDWKSIFKFAAEIPIVRRAIGATLEELEHNPNFQKFVESYQAMNHKAASAGKAQHFQCMICLFHKYGIDHGLNTLDAAPRHRCVDHNTEWFP